ncbi:Uncharacterised protein [Bordetella pertussis]|nr:Uncharacterised protein [Bordetella pertussis]
MSARPSARRSMRSSRTLSASAPRCQLCSCSICATSNGWRCASLSNQLASTAAARAHSSSRSAAG